MRLSLVAAVAASVIFSGCASYRTDAKFESKSPESIVPNDEIIIPVKGVLISPGTLPNKKHRDIGVIEVSIKKLTVFHSDPTREQANDALADKALAVGADAIINTTYKSGVGLTTWGYMDAQGTAVKLESLP